MLPFLGCTKKYPFKCDKFCFMKQFSKTVKKCVFHMWVSMLHKFSDKFLKHGFVLSCTFEKQDFNFISFGRAAGQLVAVLFRFQLFAQLGGIAHGMHMGRCFLFFLCCDLALAGLHHLLVRIVTAKLQLITW